MAIAVASTANNGYATASSIVITKPTGLAATDMMVALIHIFGNATVTTPSGWTQGTPQTSSTSQSLTYLYKIADSTDAAASNFTFNLSGSVDVAGGILRVTGQAFTTLLDSHDQDTNTNDGGGTLTFSGGVTPTNAGSLLIMAIGTNSDQQNGNYGSNALATDNPSWTEAWEVEKNLTDNNNYVHQVAYAVRPEVTATGNYSVGSGGYGGAGRDVTAFLLCFNPLVSVSSTLDIAVLTSVALTLVALSGMTATLDVANLTATPIDFSRGGQAVWSNPNKGTTPAFSNGTKHSTSWTNGTKDATTFSNQPKS